MGPISRVDIAAATKSVPGSFQLGMVGSSQHRFPFWQFPIAGFIRKRAVYVVSVGELWRFLQ
ncbi:hypothetical protein RB2258 [Rhodopirellula baltica SH 1]|uniref:Uncharacterized protein n=1 Tax=Rhodopirellula baltica (strain DSM 10527 / NCIMB 13988 / SH1) TaxID=243090 RepID=Q7UW56_RHOBA|nr:hypothetical protein RB2258 [Rhodopirellula baltica SH 1]